MIIELLLNTLQGTEVLDEDEDDEMEDADDTTNQPGLEGLEEEQGMEEGEDTTLKDDLVHGEQEQESEHEGKELLCHTEQN